VQEAFDIVNGQRLPAVERVMTSNDMIEGARAFSEKREPVWTGT
jgi:crotonobetainyl-CoA hydratase